MEQHDSATKEEKIKQNYYELLKVMLLKDDEFEDWLDIRE